MRAHSGLRDAARNSSGRKSTEAVKQIVQGIGVRGGGAAAPPAWKIQGKSVSRARSSFSTILKDKKYFNTVKNSRPDSVFHGKLRLFKILKDKNTFNTVNSGHTLFFRASTSCLNILKDKKYFTTVKYSRADFVFHGKRRLFKILKDKKYILHTVNSGHTLFFRASKSCSNILKVKSILNTAKNFMTNSFSGQAQVPQKSWKIKIFQCNEEFQGMRKLFKILND